MLTKKTNYIPNNKAPKAILWAAAALILYTIAFILLYNYNQWTEIPEWFFMPTYGALTALSAFCAAELITALFQYSMIKHMVTAAIVTALELAPLPYIWVYSSMTIAPFEAGEHIASMWITNAVVFVIIMLVIAGINFIKRRYRLKISIEKI